MSSSFSTALSGLSANATAIDVVGNNLANLNTRVSKRARSLSRSGDAIDRRGIGRDAGGIRRGHADHAG